MAEIHCPMCGKSNPDQLDICQFCEARLKPITPESIQSDEGGKLPEWWNLDQNDETGAEDIHLFEDVEDTQEWLDRIRPDSETQDEPSQDIQPDDKSISEPRSDSTTEDDILDEDENDFLVRLGRFHDGRGTEDASGTSDGSELDQDELPDWVFGEAVDGSSGTTPGAGSDDAPSSQVNGGLDSDEIDVSPEGEDDSLDPRSSLDDEEPVIEGETSEMLSGPTQDGPEAETVTQGEDEDTPDWLSELGIDDESAAPEEAEPAIEGEISDWLSGTSQDGPETVTQGEDEDTPDWLSELGIDGESAAPEEAEPAIEGEISDWLSGTSQDEPGAETVTQAEDDDTLDWLSELGIDGETTAPDEAEPAIEGEIPDWLSGPPQDVSEAETVTQGEDEGAPDWLSELDVSGAHPAVDDGPELELLPGSGDEGTDIPEELSRPGDQTPDWLFVPSEPKDSVSAEDEDLQSWFSELDHDSEPAPDSVVPDTGEEIPGWLKNLGSVVTGTVEDDIISDAKDGAALPFQGQDEFDDDLLDVESLPEWLSPDSNLPDSREEIDDSDLTHAELPGWLAAMRPVDVKRPKTPLDDGSAESTGPLTGLRSVLPAEPEITHIIKPPEYSAKLQVTSSQRAHADLFHKMLSVDGEAEPIPAPPIISSQRALRWAIAIILMLSVGIFVIGSGEFFPLPGNAAIPDATYETSKIISAIPDRAPILLAFDYEPGISGEMHAAAAALVDHLMLKGARLSLVSTLPTGPAMAEYFIQTVQSQHGYTKNQQYINLGYIPGGAAGLLSFVQTPEWVFPLSFNGMYPWDTQPLQDIDALSDFALIVVITEDPEDARAWIEQVQPRIGDTPMLTVVSAQAEPMVRPYFSSGHNAQVSGIVSGLSGGAAYEVAVGRPNLGRTYWDAFAVGLVVALGAILIGGMVNVVQMLLGWNKNNARGGKL